MTSQDEKIKLFLNAINDELEIRREKITAEIDSVRNAELDKAGKEAEERSKEYIKTESDKIYAQINRNSTAIATELRNELTAKRSSITDSVFQAVTDRLVSFTKTAEYTDFMVRSVQRIASYFSNGELTIAIRPADLPLKDKIILEAGSGCTVITDDSIVLGGCKASCKNTSVSLDDTLDSRLSEQRQSFYESSGLSVQSI